MERIELCGGWVRPMETAKKLRLSLLVAVAMSLSGCVAAPGMRMGYGEPSLSADRNHAALEEMHISITEISPDLLRKMQVEAGENTSHPDRELYQDKGP